MTTAEQGRLAANPAPSAHVLVLSGRRTVQTLKTAGYRVGLLSESIPFDLAVLADTPIQAGFSDWKAIIEQVGRAHRISPFHAVVTQLEHLLPLAGQLRDHLGLPGGISEQTARDCLDKPTTMRLLSAAGIPVAVFEVVADADAARQAASDLGLPVIVKPRDAASGAGLALCHTPDQVADAVNQIRDDGRDTALIEEYLPGTEISLFAYRLAGHTEVLTCLRAKVGPPPKFVKLGADHPSGLDADILAQVSELTDRALAAVGLDGWVATVQMMLTADGPRVMEINPRVPGGQTVELVAATTGYEPTLAAAEVALGIRPTPGVARAAYAWYRCLTFEEAGHLSYRAEAEEQVPGLETGIPPLIELDVAPGEVVLPINHPRGGVFGRIVLCGTSPQQLNRDYARILAALDLRLEPLLAAEGEATWRPHSRCC